MSTYCIQCALEAFVAGNGASVPPDKCVFDEEPREHEKRVHPNPVQTQIRRLELNRKAAEIVLAQNNKT